MHLKSMDMMIERSPDRKDLWESQQINPYWIEYHFFYNSLFKKIKKATEEKSILDWIYVVNMTTTKIN